MEYMDVLSSIEKTVHRGFPHFVDRMGACNTITNVREKSLAREFFLLIVCLHTDGRSHVGD